MRRRDILTTGTGAILALYAGVARAGTEATAYSREAFEKALASGKPFLLDFYAPW